MKLLTNVQKLITIVLPLWDELWCQGNAIDVFFSGHMYNNLIIKSDIYRLC